jgi:hypothetical protein
MRALEKLNRLVIDTESCMPVQFLASLLLNRRDSFTDHTLHPTAKQLRGVDDISKDDSKTLNPEHHSGIRPLALE